MLRQGLLLVSRNCPRLIQLFLCHFTLQSKTDTHNYCSKRFNIFSPGWFLAFSLLTLYILTPMNMPLLYITNSARRLFDKFSTSALTRHHCRTNISSLTNVSHHRPWSKKMRHWLPPKLLPTSSTSLLNRKEETLRMTR